MRLKIAISPCPNDVFIFGPLILLWIEGNLELEFSFHDIETLNILAEASDGPDLIKLSYAQAPRVRASYVPMSVGAALGCGVGPLLVGLPGQPWPARNSVLVPGLHTTANLLQKRYMSHENIVPVRYEKIMPELRQDAKKAGVVIHESRFTYEAQGLECLLDLGRCWEEETRLPLPLGGLFLKRTCSAEVSAEMEMLLKRSLNEAHLRRADLMPLLKEHAQELDEGVISRHIDLYVNEYSMELGEMGARAIRELSSISGE